MLKNDNLKLRQSKKQQFIIIENTHEGDNEAE